MDQHHDLGASDSETADPAPGSPAPTQAAPPGRTPTISRKALAWSLWDWGSASFNAVVTTFVFSRYIASDLFVDPAVADAGGPPLQQALAHNASVVANAIAIAGVLIAAIAPVMGQRSDGSGRRKLWLAINTGITVLAMLAMYFVLPGPQYLWLGAGLLAAGNLFFEFASVNYNAMLHQVATKESMGRVSGFGWGMGYVGGIVLLALLLVFFIGLSDGGLLGLPSGLDGQSLDIRLAVVASAVWFIIFALPVLIAVPELPVDENRRKVGVLQSYVVLYRTVVAIGRNNPKVLLFLISSAIFRDGMAAIFTFGSIIASSVFGFSASEVLVFAVVANVTAGIGTFVGGWADDRFGPKLVIMISLVCLIIAAAVVLFAHGKPAFWVIGLALTFFVGPVQASARSFMARITPAGREGEMFGLYATTGRAVSFLAPALFSLFVSMFGDTRYGIIGIGLVLLVGLVLIIPVQARATVIDDPDAVTAG